MFLSIISSRDSLDERDRFAGSGRGQLFGLLYPGMELIPSNPNCNFQKENNEPHITPDNQTLPYPHMRDIPGDQLFIPRVAINS